VGTIRLGMPSCLWTGGGVVMNTRLVRVRVGRDHIMTACMHMYMEMARMVVRIHRGGNRSRRGKQIDVRKTVSNREGHCQHSGWTHISNNFRGLWTPAQSAVVSTTCQQKQVRILFAPQQRSTPFSWPVRNQDLRMNVESVQGSEQRRINYQLTFSGARALRKSQIMMTVTCRLQKR
jgi:hypothetical protein